MSGILFFCSTTNFQQFTRRATIEAISEKCNGSLVLCIRSFWKRTSFIKSKIVKVKSYYYFFPAKLIKKYNFLNVVNFFFNNLINWDLLRYKQVCFTFPTQSHLVEFFKGKKKIFILSDPYHLMKQTKEDEEICINAADYIFVTARSFIPEYLPTYFSHINAKVIYWPNCVDISVWDIDYYKRTPNDKDRSKTTIGFAGNFMPNVTDLNLLESLVVNFQEQEFIIAGKIEYKKDSDDYLIMKRILNYPNVQYKGLIPFNNLPGEVYKWDICLMLDAITEVAKYHHHNKYYQYLALGKPVVYQQNHLDYENIENVTFGSSTIPQFIENLQHVINKVKDNYPFEEATKAFVNSNTNKKRAELFLKSISKNN